MSGSGREPPGKLTPGSREARSVVVMFCVLYGVLVAVLGVLVVRSVEDWLAVGVLAVGGSIAWYSVWWLRRRT